MNRSYAHGTPPTYDPVRASLDVARSGDMLLQANYDVPYTASPAPGGSVPGAAPDFGIAAPAARVPFSSPSATTPYGTPNHGRAALYRHGYEPASDSGWSRRDVPDPPPYDDGSAWWGIGLLLFSSFFVIVGATTSNVTAVVFGVIVYVIVSWVSYIGVLISAFKHDTVTGLLSWFVPFYIFFFVATGPVLKTRRWLFWTHAATGPLFIVSVVALIAVTSGAWFNPDCGRVRLHMTRFQAELSSIDRMHEFTGAQQLAPALNDLASRLRILNSATGELALESPHIEEKSVAFFKVALQIPDAVDRLARAYRTGPHDLAQDRLNAISQLRDQLERRGDSVTFACGFFIF